MNVLFHFHQASQNQQKYQKFNNKKLLMYFFVFFYCDKIGTIKILLIFNTDIQANLYSVLQYYLSNKNITKSMQKNVFRQLFNDKQNNLRNGNKNKELLVTVLPKIHNHDKLYQSVSQNIQLKPHFIKRRPTSISDQFCQLYGQDLLKQQCHQQEADSFLENHQIDSHLRARMIDWMIEVTTSYKFTNKTYFDGIQIMDRYFDAETNSVQPSKLHITGVQSMLIASKINQVYPLKIKTVFEKIGHRKLSMKDLIEVQEKIIKSLDFKLDSWTFFDLAIYEQQKKDSVGQFFFNDKQLQLLDGGRFKRMEQLCSYICKHVMFDYQFYSENKLNVLAEGCVKAVLQIMKITSIPAWIYTSSPIILEQTKQQIFRIVQNFKTNFTGLINIYRFTPQEVIAQVDQFLSG